MRYAVIFTNQNGTWIFKEDTRRFDGFKDAKHYLMKFKPSNWTGGQQLKPGGAVNAFLLSKIHAGDPYTVDDRCPLIIDADGAGWPAKELGDWANARIKHLEEFHLPRMNGYWSFTDRHSRNEICGVGEIYTFNIRERWRTDPATGKKGYLITYK